MDLTGQSPEIWTIAFNASDDPDEVERRLREFWGLPKKRVPKWVRGLAIFLGRYILFLIADALIWVIVIRFDIDLHWLVLVLALCIENFLFDAIDI